RLAGRGGGSGRCLEEAVARHPGGSVEVHETPMYQPMAVGDDTTIMRLVRVAAERVGRPITTAGMGGGCDANILNERGLEVVNLGTGMQDIHTTREWLPVSDMAATPEVPLHVIALAGDQQPLPSPG